MIKVGDLVEVNDIRDDLSIFRITKIDTTPMGSLVCYGKRLFYGHSKDYKPAGAGCKELRVSRNKITSETIKKRLEEHIANIEVVIKTLEEIEKENENHISV